MRQIVKQLGASMRTVERLILDAAPDLLGKGNATVVNQHSSLSRAYEYFQDRAIDPEFIADEHTQPTHGFTITIGKTQMDLNAFHDMVAAISAYLRLLEHDLVLASRGPRSSDRNPPFRRPPRQCRGPRAMHLMCLGHAARHQGRSSDSVSASTL